jgi:predicted helicase
MDYRPFDRRSVYYKVGFTSRAADSTMQHMLSAKNIALVTCRLLSSDGWQHIFVTNTPAESSFVSDKSREFGRQIPIYEYSKIAGTVEKRENFLPEFRRYIDEKYNNVYPAEEVVGYIYAVLHSRSYRERYSELLKLDFPRIPFVDDVATFECLADLGWELIQVHLMEHVPNDITVPLKGTGDGTDAKLAYHQQTKRVQINDTQYFENITPDVWDFRIGGYDVLDKYLKGRKKAARPLTLDEIQHVPKIVNVLAWTIKQMDKIEQNFCCP